MKINKTQLRQIIAEEIQNVINEKAQEKLDEFSLRGLLKKLMGGDKAAQDKAASLPPQAKKELEQAAAAVKSGDKEKAEEELEDLDQVEDEPYLDSWQDANINPEMNAEATAEDEAFIAAIEKAMEMVPKINTKSIKVDILVYVERLLAKLAKEKNVNPEVLGNAGKLRAFGP